MPVDHTLVLCPRCLGEKGAIAFVHYADKGCTEEWMPCGACRGSGEITVARLAVFKRGDAIRDRRIALDLSLREAAAKFNMTPMEFGDVEHGLAMPESFEKAEAALTKLEAGEVSHGE